NAGERIDERHRGRGGAAEARHDTQIEVLRLVLQIDLPRHGDVGGRAGHAQFLQLHHAALDARYGVDAIEAKALRKHVAEVEPDAPRQRLQVHERDQLADAGIDLEELAVLSDEPEIAAQAGIVDAEELTLPAHR